MNSQITIGVVDDQQLFKLGMIALLKEFPKFKITLEAEDGRDLLEKLKTPKYKKNIPEVLLLDIEMPNMNGIDATVALRKKYPSIKIIILTMYNEEEMIMHLIERGANGFLPKNSNISIVADAIVAVKENGYYFTEQVSKVMVKGLVVSKRIKPTFNKAKLTDRELEIITLICRELTNKEIGEILYLNNRTVDEYRRRILEKTGAKNTAGIVMYALKNNLAN